MSAATEPLQRARVNLSPYALSAERLLRSRLSSELSVRRCNSKKRLCSPSPRHHWHLKCSLSLSSRHRRGNQSKCTAQRQTWPPTRRRTPSSSSSTATTRCTSDWKAEKALQKLRSTRSRARHRRRQGLRAVQDARDVLEGGGGGVAAAAMRSTCATRRAGRNSGPGHASIVSACRTRPTGLSSRVHFRTAKRTSGVDSLFTCIIVAECDDRAFRKPSRAVKAAGASDPTACMLIATA